MVLVPAQTYRFALTAFNGSQSRYSAEALYNSPALELDRIDIEGPANIQERSLTQYNLRAYYTNNTNSQVNASSWSVNCPEAGVSSDGLVSVGVLTANAQCTLNADYTSGGVTHNDQLNILVEDTDDATLDRIEIIGPNDVDENTSTTYVCRATFSDGTFLNIMPITWSITTGTSIAGITSDGVLNTQEVGSDGTVVIRADYTGNQSPYSDEIQVAVHNINTDPPPPPPSSPNSNLIIDNGDPGTSHEGTWRTSSGLSPYDGS